MFLCVCIVRVYVLGTDLMSENTIIDLPTGVVTFYMDTHEPRTPGLYAYSTPWNLTK